MERYRIVLADDHVLFRRGVMGILERVGHLEVVGEADDGLALLTLLKRMTPDLVILDISMPRLRGLEAIAEIRAISSKLKVLVLSMHKDRAYVLKAIAAGSHGYLLKEDAEDELFTAIDKVRQGKVYLSPKLSDTLAEAWSQTCQGSHTADPEEGPLTLRETQVLKLVAEGRSAKEIADLLCISCRTVEHHRANVMAKLHLRGVADVVKYALSEGYL